MPGRIRAFVSLLPAAAVLLSLRALAAQQIERAK
jgi:hypothetical protein